MNRKKLAVRYSDYEDGKMQKILLVKLNGFGLIQLLNFHLIIQL